MKMIKIWITKFFNWLSNTTQEIALKVTGTEGGGFYITWPDGRVYAGPYKRAQDAKGQLTRITKD